MFDGTSNTLLVGERNSSLGYSTWVGVVHGVKHAVPRIVGTTGRAPNDPQATFEDFSSHHPGGALFVLVDGSIRMVHETIEVPAFRALGTRGGGEVNVQ